MTRREFIESTSAALAASAAMGSFSGIGFGAVAQTNGIPLTAAADSFYWYQRMIQSNGKGLEGKFALSPTQRTIIPNA